MLIKVGIYITSIACLGNSLLYICLCARIKLLVKVLQMIPKRGCNIVFWSFTFDNNRRALFTYSSRRVRAVDNKKDQISLIMNLLSILLKRVKVCIYLYVQN